MTNHFDNLNIADCAFSLIFTFQHRTSSATMNREIPGFYYGKSCFDAFLELSSFLPKCAMTVRKRRVSLCTSHIQRLYRTV